MAFCSARLCSQCCRVITIGSPAWGLGCQVLMVSASLPRAQCPHFLHRRLCHLLVLLPGALRGETSCHPADEHLPAMLAGGQRRPHTHPAASLPGLPERRPEQGMALFRGHICPVPSWTSAMQRSEGIKDSSPARWEDHPWSVWPYQEAEGRECIGRARQNREGWSQDEASYIDELGAGQTLPKSP